MPYSYLLIVSLQGQVADSDVVVPRSSAPHPVVGEGLPGQRVQREPALHGDVVALPRIVLLVVASHILSN